MPNEYTKDPCPICDGTGNLDDVDGEERGRTCKNCHGSGEAPRPVRWSTVHERPERAAAEARAAVALLPDSVPGASYDMVLAAWCALYRTASVDLLPDSVPVAHVDPKPTIPPGEITAHPDLCPACKGTGVGVGVCHNCGGWGSVTVYRRQGKVFSDRPWEPKKWGRP